MAPSIPTEAVNDESLLIARSVTKVEIRTIPTALILKGPNPSFILQKTPAKVREPMAATR